VLPSRAAPGSPHRRSPRATRSAASPGGKSPALIRPRRTIARASSAPPKRSPRRRRFPLRHSPQRRPASQADRNRGSAWRIGSTDVQRGGYAANNGPRQPYHEPIFCAISGGNPAWMPASPSRRAAACMRRAAWPHAIRPPAQMHRARPAAPTPRRSLRDAQRIAVPYTLGRREDRPKHKHPDRRPCFYMQPASALLCSRRTIAAVINARPRRGRRPHASRDEESGRQHRSVSRTQLLRRSAIAASRL